VAVAHKTIPRIIFTAIGFEEVQDNCMYFGSQTGKLFFLLRDQQLKTTKNKFIASWILYCFPSVKGSILLLFMIICIAMDYCTCA
jgi:hypothetical protein